MQGYFYRAIESSAANTFKRKTSGDGNPFGGIEIGLAMLSVFSCVVLAYPPHKKTIMW